MADEAQRFDDQEPAPSVSARIVKTAVMGVVALGVAWVFVRLVSPPVRPDQVAPAAHAPGRCAWCHTVSKDAEPIKVE